MKAGPRTRIEVVKMDEVEDVLERIKSAVSAKDYELLKKLVASYTYVTGLVEEKGTTIERLRQLLFGQRSEKTKKVFKGGSDKAPGASGGRSGALAAQGAEKPRGHGRNGVDAYTGAERIKISHGSLKAGDTCPGCAKGKVYTQVEPAVIVRIEGQPPLKARVFELERLRCALCGDIFTAEAPAGVGEEKYDATSAAMIVLLKYGAGLPFNRLEKLEGNLGIPLPASTQWEIVEGAAEAVAPAYEELVREAAQGEVLHNDDTSMKILALMKDRPEGEEEKKRKGVFTSGIVSTLAKKKIALFFTGQKHAGENLADLLRQRALELSAPIQMCDALARNLPGELEVILANCLAHGRRKFVEVAASFPEQCKHVLETLRDVYHNDALATKNQLSALERLRFHQAESRPLMDSLHGWMKQQLDQKKVEPNSGLGEALSYMLAHWQELTLFVREAGAPLDNNICERALKKAILHRKNALFYKTENGARVGDMFMSLIHTAELSGANPFEYITALQQHAGHVRENPGNWMPWNWRSAIKGLDTS